MKVSNQNRRKENKKSDINNLEEDKEGCLPLVVGFKEKKKGRPKSDTCIRYMIYM